MYKEYENLYWSVEKSNDVLVGKLYFKQFNDYEMILQWQQNDKEKDTFYYQSDLLNAVQDVLFADTPNEAMEQFVDIIEECIQDQISYYGDMLEKFNEEKIK